MNIQAYICPLCGEVLTDKTDKNIICRQKHSFEVINDDIVLFDCAAEDSNEYNIDHAAEMHDNAFNWLFAVFGGNIDALRCNLIDRLKLQEGQNILVTGAGSCDDLPYIAKQIGKTGHIYAQDFSKHMILAGKDRCLNKYELSDYNITLCISDATNLPYPDNHFDAVYHFGGLNIYSDVAKGILEMDRVANDGARVVFGDEGLPAWLKDTDYGRMIITNNPLCAAEIPLEHIPATARDVNLSWDMGYCFYIIDYTASKSPLPCDIDVTHIGTRGGSLRTRYYGQLEGVSPELKEALYDAAKEQGISRVEFLEKILRDGLGKQKT